MVQDDVLRIRRSRVKLAPWLLLSVVFAAGFVRYFIPLGVGAKIIGIVGAVFFSWGVEKGPGGRGLPRERGRFVRMAAVTPSAADGATGLGGVFRMIAKW